jgi:hypothetical protein
MRFLLFLGLLVAARPVAAQPNGPWLLHPAGERNTALPDGQVQQPLAWLGVHGMLSVTTVHNSVVNKEAEFALPHITKAASDSLQAVFAAMTEDLVFALGPPDTTLERPFEDIPLNSEEPYRFTLGRMVWSLKGHRVVSVELQAVQEVNSRQLVLRLFDKRSRLPRNQAQP